MEKTSEVPTEVISYFQNQTQEKDPTAKPVEHIKHFRDGIARYEPGLQPLFDGFASTLVPNFEKTETIEESGIIIPALKSEKSRIFSEQFHEQRQIKPIIVIIPHPSIASPYIAARYVNMPFSDEVAEKTYSVVGPRPMLYDYQSSVGDISPYYLGTMLNNLLLTGTNTNSVDNAPEEVKEWLTEQGKVFKDNLNELMEPKEYGDNNVLIVCPSGKIGQQRKTYVKEFLPRSYKFAAGLADRAVYWPIGIFDRVLVDPQNPSSSVYVNTDGLAHDAHKDNEDDIYTLHLRAIELATSSIGRIKMQTHFDARGRGLTRKIREFRKN